MLIKKLMKHSNPVSQLIIIKQQPTLLLANLEESKEGIILKEDKRKIDKSTKLKIKYLSII